MMLAYVYLLSCLLLGTGINGEITNDHEETGVPNSGPNDAEAHQRPSEFRTAPPDSGSYANWDSTVKSTYYPQRPYHDRRGTQRSYRNQYYTHQPDYNRNYTTTYYNNYNSFVPQDQQSYYATFYGQPRYDYTPAQYYYSQPAYNPNYPEQYNDPRYGQQQNYPQQQYHYQYSQRGDTDFRQTPSNSDQHQSTMRTHPSSADVPISTQQINAYSRRQRSRSMNAKTTPTGKPSSSPTEVGTETEATTATTATTRKSTETTTAVATTATTAVTVTRTSPTTTTRMATTGTTARTATTPKSKTARMSRMSSTLMWTAPTYVSRRWRQGPQREREEHQQAGRPSGPMPRQQRRYPVSRGSSTTLKPQEEEKKGRFSRLCKFVKGIFRKLTFCKDEEEDEDEETEPRHPEQDTTLQSYDDGIDQRTSSYRPRRVNPYRNYDPDQNHRPYQGGPSRYQQRNPDANYPGPSRVGSFQNGPSRYQQRYPNTNYNGPSDAADFQSSPSRYQPRNPDTNYYSQQSVGYYPNRYQQRNTDTNYYSPSSAAYYSRDWNAINQQGNFDDQKNYNRRFNYKPSHYDYNHPDSPDDKPKPYGGGNYAPDANNVNSDYFNPSVSPNNF